MWLSLNDLRDSFASGLIELHVPETQSKTSFDQRELLALTDGGETVHKQTKGGGTEHTTTGTSIPGWKTLSPPTPISPEFFAHVSIVFSLP